MSVIELLSLIVSMFCAGFTVGMAVCGAMTRRTLQRIAERSGERGIQHIANSLDSEGEAGAAAEEESQP